MVVAGFLRLIRAGDPGGHDRWLDEAAVSPVGSFAKGVAADKAATTAAITLPWSNGQTEGQICGLKLIKRQMSGRGDIDLLKASLTSAA